MTRATSIDTGSDSHLETGSHERVAAADPNDGFACDGCGAVFTWTDLAGFGGGRRYCEGCAVRMEVAVEGATP